MFKATEVERKIRQINLLIDMQINLDMQIHRVYRLEMI